jgi:hypothetical protein
MGAKSNAPLVIGPTIRGITNKALIYRGYTILAVFAESTM